MRSKSQKCEVIRLYQSGMSVPDVFRHTEVPEMTIFRWTKYLLEKNREKYKLSKIKPRVAQEWHLTKNGKLTPNDVMWASNKKVWWTCLKGHEWKAKISQRTKKDHATNCPYCATQMVCKDNCLSVINPQLSEEWHPTKNGNLTPKDVLPGAFRKVWWKCKIGHEWSAGIYARSGGHGCPYCSNKKVCDDNCLATVNPQLSKEWHPTKNGSLTPEDVLPVVSRKVWWICDEGHEWCTKIAHRSNGSGCPTCNTHIYESKCREIFENIFGFQFPTRKRFLNKLYELDGYCDELKLAFEYNGQQHYNFIPYWHKTIDNLKRQQERDARKAKLCIEKGITLIVIPYTENNRLKDFIVSELKQRCVI